MSGRAALVMTSTEATSLDVRDYPAAVLVTLTGDIRMHHAKPLTPEVAARLAEGLRELADSVERRAPQ